MILDNLTGQTINDRFLLEEKFPGGNMGVVYRAVDLRISQQVDEDTRFVVKFLSADSEESKARFRLEARTLLSLQHTNICRIYDIDEWRPPEGETGYLFIVMKYYEGDTLEELIRQEGAMPQERIRDIVLQVAQGLLYAHRKSVYHRDLKPANIMVGPEGKVTILDFGIVRNVMVGNVTQFPGFVVGTPFYMSPEQARGEDVDHRSDIWSLGVIAHEMSTGRRPFKDLSSILDDAPEILPPVVREDMRQVVSRALKKKPKHRFTDCGELIDVLSRDSDSAPGHMDPNKSTAKMESVQGRTTISRRVLMVVLVIVIGCVLAWMWWISGGTDDGADEHWKSTAQQAIAEGRRDEGILAWLQALRHSDLDEWRREVAGAIGLDYRNLVATLRHGDAEVCALAFSPDGKTIATGSPGGVLRFWDAVSGEPFGGPIRHRGELWTVAFSPDGKRVATGGSDESGLGGVVRLWDFETRDPIDLENGISHENTVTRIKFSRSGDSILTAGVFSVRVWRADSGERVGGTAMRHDGYVSEVWFGQSERVVMTADSDGNIWRWEGSSVDLQETVGDISVAAVAVDDKGDQILASSGKYQVAVRHLPPEWKEMGIFHEEGVTSLALNPGGKLILVGTADGVARVWDLSGNPIGKPLIHSAKICATEFSPDGSTVLTAGMDGVARLWRVDTDSDAETSFMEHPSSVSAAAFHSDDDIALTGTVKGDLRVWTFGEKEPKLEKSQLHDSVSVVAFAPSGTMVVSGGYDSNVRCVDVESGRITSCVQDLHKKGVNALEFTPDGSRFATGSDDGTVRIWSVGTTVPALPPLRHGDPVTSLAFSSDGTHIVVGTDFGKINLWDAQSGTPMEELEIFQGRIVTALTFGAVDGGEVVVAANVEGEVGIWNMDSREQLGSILHHGHSVESLGFIASDRIIIVAEKYWLHSYSMSSDDGEMRLLGNNLMPGGWTGAYRLGKLCGECLEVVLKNTVDSLFVETVFYGRSGRIPIEGDANDLYRRWAGRLSLEFDKETSDFKSPH